MVHRGRKKDPQHGRFKRSKAEVRAIRLANLVKARAALRRRRR